LQAGARLFFQPEDGDFGSIGTLDVLELDRFGRLVPRCAEAPVCSLDGGPNSVRSDAKQDCGEDRDIGRRFTKSAGGWGQAPFGDLSNREILGASTPLGGEFLYGHIEPGIERDSDLHDALSIRRAAAESYCAAKQHLNQDRCGPSCVT
jgi:hypothetical protein